MMIQYVPYYNVYISTIYSLLSTLCSFILPTHPHLFLLRRLKYGDSAGHVPPSGRHRSVNGTAVRWKRRETAQIGGQSGLWIGCCSNGEAPFQMGVFENIG